VIAEGQVARTGRLNEFGGRAYMKNGFLGTAYSLIHFGPTITFFYLQQTPLFLSPPPLLLT
jgi:hypothetical protein